MKINNIVITTVFVLGVSLLSTPAFAEEVVEEAPVVEPIPESEPEYVPPSEAYDGAGGWGIVNPETGQVVDGVVCTTDVCGPNGSWGGVVPEGILIDGCPESGCVFRFQSKASEDGNVAGYHSDGYNDVRWNKEDQNFSITDALGRGSTLLPERTEGGLLSGIVDIRSKSVTEKGVVIEQIQEDYLDEEIETKVLFPEWVGGGKMFLYRSALEAGMNIESDVDNELFLEGYTTEETNTLEFIDEETEKLTTETITKTVIDEESIFVKTVRVWTESVINFFRGIFS